MASLGMFFFISHTLEAERYRQNLIFLLLTHPQLFQIQMESPKIINPNPLN